MLVDYNKLTKEITCNGIKMSGVVNAPIPNGNSTVVKLEEQRFVHFDDSNCEVNIFIKTIMISINISVSTINGLFMISISIIELVIK